MMSSRSAWMNSSSSLSTDSVSRRRVALCRFGEGSAWNWKSTDALGAWGGRDGFEAAAARDCLGSFLTIRRALSSGDSCTTTTDQIKEQSPSYNASQTYSATRVGDHELGHDSCRPTLNRFLTDGISKTVSLTFKLRSHFVKVWSVNRTPPPTLAHDGVSTASCKFNSECLK
jgi:hypothetical protein